MDNQAKIAQLFSNIVQGGNKNKYTFFTAEVASVQGNTCTVEFDGLLIAGVRLTPTIPAEKGKNSVLLTPAIGTYVLIASPSGNLSNLSVIAADAISEAQITIGEISVTIDKEGIVLNGGELGGLVKLQDLVSKINKLESQLNTLKNIFGTWIPPVAPAIDNGAALKAAITTWASQTIPLTQPSDLENKKIKQ